MLRSESCRSIAAARPTAPLKFMYVVGFSRRIRRPAIATSAASPCELALRREKRAAVLARARDRRTKSPRCAAWPRIRGPGCRGRRSSRCGVPLCNVAPGKERPPCGGLCVRTQTQAGYLPAPLTALPARQASSAFGVGLRGVAAAPAASPSRRFGLRLRGHFAGGRLGSSGRRFPRRAAR